MWSASYHVTEETSRFILTVGNDLRFSKARWARSSASTATAASTCGRRELTGWRSNFHHLTGHYITTERSDYLSLDWTYEITVHSPANATDEVLFVGFGEAVQDPLFYNEPQNSVYLAIHTFSQGASLGSDVRLSAHDVGMWSHTYLQFPGSFGGPQGSTYTVRMRKVGRSVTFEILGTDVAATIPDILAAAPFLSQVPTRIFFGNAFGNYTFSDMRVLPERPRGQKK